MQHRKAGLLRQILAGPRKGAPNMALTHPHFSSACVLHSTPWQASPGTGGVIAVALGRSDSCWGAHATAAAEAEEDVCV
eukprot:scaffold129986_cov14-Tisochrysis_lutea.AAC.1